MTNLPALEKTASFRRGVGVLMLTTLRLAAPSLLLLLIHAQGKLVLTLAYLGLLPWIAVICINVLVRENWSRFARLTARDIMMGCILTVFVVLGMAWYYQHVLLGVYGAAVHTPAITGPH